MQEFLATTGVEIKSQANAKQEKMDASQVDSLLRDAKTVIVAKGQKFMKLNLNDPNVTRAEVFKLVMGPTGNLRAPTLRVGKTLLVGFHAEMLAEYFG